MSMVWNDVKLENLLKALWYDQRPYAQDGKFEDNSDKWIAIYMYAVDYELTYFLV